MSYERVIPRDLFNDANLLKCLGRVYINIENKYENVSLDFGGEDFDICKVPATGETYSKNVMLYKGDTHIELFRPLNSREEWPLIAVDSETETEYSVFNPDGSFTKEFDEFLKS